MESLPLPNMDPAHVMISPNKQSVRMPQNIIGHPDHSNPVKSSKYMEYEINEMMLLSEEAIQDTTNSTESSSTVARSPSRVNRLIRYYEDSSPKNRFSLSSDWSGCDSITSLMDDRDSTISTVDRMLATTSEQVNMIEMQYQQPKSRKLKKRRSRRLSQQVPELLLPPPHSNSDPTPRSTSIIDRFQVLCDALMSESSAVSPRTPHPTMTLAPLIEGVNEIASMLRDTVDRKRSGAEVIRQIPSGVRRIVGTMLLTAGSIVTMAGEMVLTGCDDTIAMHKTQNTSDNTLAKTSLIGSGVRLFFSLCTTPLRALRYARIGR